MASTTVSRAGSLPTKKVTLGAGLTIDAVENFAIFIDTHRDQPHVPTFEKDIHRGMSRPTLVHYLHPDAVYPLGALIREEDKQIIACDPKHRFVTVEWWSEFITEFLLDHGESPVAETGDAKGQLPTSHLRNARTKVYKLKSLRQIVKEHEIKASMAGGRFVPSGGFTVTFKAGKVTIPLTSLVKPKPPKKKVPA